MTKARDLANSAAAFSAVSATELGYVDGVTSAIQTQLDAKIAKTLTSTTGDIIYASAANTPARLGIGSSAQILTVASGIPSWSTPAASASGLTLISAEPFSGMTTLSINNCFSATYKNYRIVTEFIGSTGNNLLIRMRNGGTDDTTNNYRWAMNYISAASGAIGNQDFGNTLTYGAIGWNVGASGQYQGTSCDVFNPFAAQITSISGNGTGSTNGMLFFNTHYVASSFDGFTVYPSGGNVTGSIRVYGYQNS